MLCNCITDKTTNLRAQAMKTTAYYFVNIALARPHFLSELESEYFTGDTSIDDIHSPGPAIAKIGL